MIALVFLGVLVVSLGAARVEDTAKSENTMTNPHSWDG